MVRIHGWLIGEKHGRGGEASSRLCAVVGDPGVIVATMVATPYSRSRAHVLESPAHRKFILRVALTRDRVKAQRFSARNGNAYGCCFPLEGVVGSLPRDREYGPIIQDLFKQRNDKFGYKPFTLHLYYEELTINEKWTRRVAETAPKRSRLRICIEDDDEEDEDANKRLDCDKIARERKLRGAFDVTYKE
ncbi:60S ribosomal protein L36a [Hordeum vulgare]|nr:60S ribosomal protein L36a [Hordeum vulgare]